MKMWLGASIIAGMSAIATTPAVAGSLTGATLIGSE
ncbi:MAG: PEP-CTERM sorting domain-containing protein, partial [Moorea sp. SIO3I7]|nr:PEP-CTERM sorting domain-containing protein [Moorena sp. SIO3I7]